MSENKISSLSRIDQAIRGINEDSGDDSYIPAQSENGALERIQKSIENLDIKGIKTGLPKVTNADNGKVLQAKNGKWGKGDPKLVNIDSESFIDHFSEHKNSDTLYLVTGDIKDEARLNPSIDSYAAASGIVVEGPVTFPPREIIQDHLAWQAFHDDDEYGGWTTNYDSASEGGPSYIEYHFDSDVAHNVSITGFEFQIAYDYIGDDPTPPTDPIPVDIKVYICREPSFTNWEHLRDFGYPVGPEGGIFGYVDALPSTIYGIRFVSGMMMYRPDDRVLSLGNIKFTGVELGEDALATSVWYRGRKYADISDGGSGGGSAINECIYYGNGQSNPSQINLSKPYTNYDFLIVRTLRSADSKVYKSDNVFEVLGLATNDYIQSIGWPADDNYWTYQIADNTTLAKTAEGMNNNYNIYEIYGIKLGSGGQSSSGGPTRTVLYEPPAGEVGALFDAQNDMLTLADDVRNYDEIIIIPATTEGNNDFYCTGEQTFRTADLLVPASQRNDFGMGIRFRAFRSTGNEEAAVRLILDNDNFPSATSYQTLWCESATGIYGPFIHRVIGVKY